MLSITYDCKVTSSEKSEKATHVKQYKHAQQSSNKMSKNPLLVLQMHVV